MPQLAIHEEPPSCKSSDEQLFPFPPVEKPVEDAILSELITAAEFLRADQTWLDLLAENIHWSSC